MTAYRGELSRGDHAEYTILERKCKDIDLSDCYLFVTLEPCAPGSRKTPKCECSTRVIDRNITKIFVGIEDPHPTVNGQGFKALEDAGIEFDMFPKDLQEIILNENNDFIDYVKKHPISNNVLSHQISYLDSYVSTFRDELINSKSLIHL